jgi:hypothetical protein
MRRWITAATALGLLLGGSAAADVYRWTDDAGKLHFTSNLDDVPPRYRQQASGEGRGSTGNVNIVGGAGPGSAAAPRNPRPFSTHADDPAPATEELPDVEQRRAGSGADAAPERRYETKCNARGDDCRRYQTQEFKDWKNRQLPSPAAPESAD